MKDLTLAFPQLDGAFDLDSDGEKENKIPSELGNLNTEDINIFHFLTMCRGFETKWYDFMDHGL